MILAEVFAIISMAFVGQVVDGAFELSLHCKDELSLVRNESPKLPHNAGSMHAATGTQLCVTNTKWYCST